MSFLQQWESRGADCTCAPMHMSYRLPCKVHCDCWNGEMSIAGSCRRCGKPLLYIYIPEEIPPMTLLEAFQYIVRTTITAGAAVAMLWMVYRLARFMVDCHGAH